MKTETGSVGPSNVTARGITVKISVCSAAITRLRSVSPRSGEGGRVLIPGNRSPVDIDEGRIAVVAAELALDTEFDRLVEERDLDLHGQGCATVGLLRVLIGEGQIELDRDVDEPEHAERAAHAQIAGKRRAQVAAWILALQREIDPRHDVHFGAASSSLRPAVSSCRWKKPPPPKIATVSRNGCARSETLKSKTGLPSRNGSVSAAPRLTSLSAKTPIASGGSATAKPARMPVGDRSRLGPSPNRPRGMALRSSSTKLRSPVNWIGVVGSSATVTSGFAPLTEVKANLVKLTVSESRMVTSKSVSSPWNLKLPGLLPPAAGMTLVISPWTRKLALASGRNFAGPTVTSFTSGFQSNVVVITLSGGVSAVAVRIRGA